MVRNPSCPPPNLVPADQLFVDGILLPLQYLHLQNENPPNLPPEIPSQPPPAATSSKRWTDIFKKTPAPAKTHQDDKEKDKLEKKKERKSQTTATSAELNINIWPFSRSRSAGNGGARPRMFPGTRKVNSAPCSRSNSSGDSKSRKSWPSSPGRPGGVHLGRSSPVWQVRRPKNSYSEQVASKKESRRTNTGGGVNSKTTQVVNLNGPMCVGYRQHVSCRSDGAAAAGNTSGNVGSGSTLFNLRGLFSKKVY
ncbi:hypothetical protein M5689_002398 [Euphorbia peplus]|nr:hypothetical protein M5689_002398 [Euphorbia peplus]